MCQEQNPQNLHKEQMFDYWADLFFIKSFQFSFSTGVSSRILSTGVHFISPLSVPKTDCFKGTFTRPFTVLHLDNVILKILQTSGRVWKMSCPIKFNTQDTVVGESLSFLHFRSTQKVLVITKLELPSNGTLRD